MTREYVLMNRDLPVLRFACERNAFDEPEFSEIEWLTELRPIGYGKLGDFPSVVPIKVKVTDKSLNRTQDFAARIAYDEDFLPQISGGIAYAAMSKVSDNLGASTANVKFTIRTNAVKSGKVERSNMFYNTADVGQIAVAEIMGPG